VPVLQRERASFATRTCQFCNVNVSVLQRERASFATWTCQFCNVNVFQELIWYQAFHI